MFLPNIEIRDQGATMPSSWNRGILSTPLHLGNGDLYLEQGTTVDVLDIPDVFGASPEQSVELRRVLGDCALCVRPRGGFFLTARSALKDAEKNVRPVPLPISRDTYFSGSCYAADRSWGSCHVVYQRGEKTSLMQARLQLTVPPSGEFFTSFPSLSLIASATRLELVPTSCVALMSSSDAWIALPPDGNPLVQLDADGRVIMLQPMTGKLMSLRASQFRLPVETRTAADFTRFEFVRSREDGLWYVHKPE